MTASCSLARVTSLSPILNKTNRSTPFPTPMHSTSMCISLAFTCSFVTSCNHTAASAASAHENIEWINNLVAYIARVAQTKPHIKIIGICFGHQIIARALGGECVPNGGRWELGPTPLQLTDLGKRIFGSDELTIQQMHRDHVPSVPPSFHLLGSTNISPNQGMVRFVPPFPSPSIDPSSNPTDTHQQTLSSTPLPPIQILTTQGHPEFNSSIVSSIIEQRVASGAIGIPAAEDAKRRLKEEQEEEEGAKRRVEEEEVDEVDGDALKTRLRTSDARSVVGKVVWRVILGEM
ncbi:hypothetical protein M413DRAFT_443508 [Hebeloma cylindrosporum]|uniref:Glutamine amidotransferase domain-containing protein n=1 Tax=Hebeloma cylindrosporum TaxID=76867 RepID=A0A0C2YRG5_HEBCY|nr:hypothetical protein M413DRAFT_443508 [Hebeloma cylindrosporum h7]